MRQLRRPQDMAGPAARAAMQVASGAAGLTLAAFLLLGGILWLLLDVPAGRAAVAACAGVGLLAAALLLRSLQRAGAHHSWASPAARQVDALRYALRASRAGIWEFAPSGRSVDLTEGALRIAVELQARLDCGALNTADALAHLHPADLPRILALAGQCLSGAREECAVAFRARGRDGAYRWLQARGRPERGESRRWTGVILDVDEERRQHAHAEAVYRIFESAPEALLLADGERRALAVNARFEKLSGRPASTLIGLALEEIVFRHAPGALPRVLEGISQRGRWSGVVDWACGDGQVNRLDLRVGSHRDADGRIVNYRVLAFDLAAMEAARRRRGAAARRASAPSVF